MRKLHLVSYTLNFVALVAAAVWYLDHELNTPLRSPAKTSATATPSAAATARRAQVTSHPVELPGADPKAKIKGVIEYLRAAGYGPSAVTGIARFLLRQEFEDQRKAILHSDTAPLWQSHTVVASAEQQAQLNELGKSFETELRALVGPNYDSATTAQNVGLLLSDRIPDAKKAAITQIASDYQAARIANAGALSPTARQQLEAKKLADIQAVLSPEEMQEYLTYNSTLADSVQARLGSANIDDATYRKIISAVADYRRSSGLDPYDGHYNGDFQATLGQFQAIRQVVGDNVAGQISMNGDANFREVSAVLTSAGDAPAMVADKYEEYLRFHAAMGTMSQPNTRAEAAQRAYAVLTAGLSEDAKRQFDATKTGSALVRLKPGQ